MAACGSKEMETNRWVRKRRKIEKLDRHTGSPRRPRRYTRTYLMHKGELDHVFVVHKIAAHIHILHGQNIVGVIRQINDLVVMVILVLSFTRTREHILFRLEFRHRDGRLVAVRLELQRRDPTMVIRTEVHLGYLFFGLFVLGHDGSRCWV